VSKKFETGRRPFEPAEISTSQLVYVRKAAELIEKYVKQHGRLPSWGESNVQQAAQLLGMVCAYTAQAAKEKMQ